MEIRYLQHHQIDADRWDKAIDTAENGLIYAYSWYLDVVTDKNWDALVLEDYSLIMPLPHNRKLFRLFQVYQPILSQQLGVFGNNISEATYFAFLEHIPSKFRLINMQVSHLLSAHKSRTNLTLPLSKPYDELMKNFSSSLRKNLRKCKEYRFSETDDVSQLIQFYAEQLEAKVHFGAQNYLKAKCLFEQVLEKNKGHIYEVKLGTALVACGMFLHSNQRIINVFGASSSKPDHRNGMAFMMAEVMHLHAGSNVVFDFEGSDIPGVKKFFESFGAKNQPYSSYSRNTLPWWIKLLLKR